MTPTEQLLATIDRHGAFGIVRTADADSARTRADAALAAGLGALEVSLVTPGALRIIEALRSAAPYALVGAGTVTNETDARSAIDAGAQFVVSPAVDVGVLSLAAREDVPAVPGAMTPTEIVTATTHGARVVKLFPAGTLGTRYLRELRGPLPHVALVPTGGIALDDVPAWWKAGAVGCGLGGALLDGTPAEIRAAVGRLADQRAEFLGTAPTAGRNPS
ncbi:2-keto-3-deoxy-phosphogluconate aldolase [Luteimicrobium album]|uniref:2-keto-3-deoxy-phosphogluconate aldolase n=1 Tax=Luteimicrobium album TaxID=1054550 RepID=A0ABQ6HYV4_9MICO|nr:bifunctional 4-hydroxy-2-oxoglutarate aldolase/2-dehydro-3-deoxy-phosphogluconate aldolase [Luteimicrobium album]GMA23679.1 2-keto-3-deoxy-phosphogluconate aldolase [Luteimicrobium album]